MKKKKIKFSPKLQSSSLDDIKKFVPKNALNTPVISEYNTLPASYQKGGVTSLGPIDFNDKSSGSFTKKDWDRLHEDKRSRIERFLGTETYNKLKDRPEGSVENVGELIDPLGSLSWNDALQSHDQWHKSGRTYPTFDEGVEMFGAVPMIGKAKKGFTLVKGAKGDIIKAGKKIRTVANNVQRVLNIGDATKDIYGEDLPAIKSIQPTRPGTFSGVPLYQNGGIGEGGKPQAIISSGQNVEALQRVLNNIYPELNLNTEGVWGPKTQAAYQKYKREYSGVPVSSNKTGAITSLIGDIARKQFNKATGLETRPSPMSERELTAEQIAVLNRTAKDALASGRRYIDYDDFKKEGAIDVNEAYRGDIENKEAIKNILSNPATQMQSTIGASDIVITPAYETAPSDTLVVDRYDFNPGSYGIEESEDIGFKEAWDKSKSDSAYQTARNLAQYLGSDPGDPSSRQSIINIGS